MIKGAEPFADGGKKVKGGVDAQNAFDGYIPSLRFAPGGSGGNKGLRGKMGFGGKEKILGPLKGGPLWLGSHPGAGAGGIKEKPQGVGGFCAPIVLKFFGSGGGSRSPGEGGGEGAPGGLLGGPLCLGLTLVALCWRGLLPIANVKTGASCLGVAAPVFF
eukprot:UN2886